jgi:hypothetical protein
MIEENYLLIEQNDTNSKRIALPGLGHAGDYSTCKFNRSHV